MFVLKFCFAALLVVSISVSIVTTARPRKVIDYEEIPTFNNYESVIELGDETLEPIYEFSKDFIDATVPINFDVALGGDFEWQDGIEKYAGLLSYVIIMLVIGLLMPLIGIIFCASRCCCNCCGAKDVQRHPNQGNTSIIVAGGFATVFSAFIIFAMAVGMRSNVVMEDGMENVFDKMIVTLNDMIKYSDNTYKQLDHLMTKNYKQFSHELNAELLDIGRQIDATINTSDLKDIDSGLINLKDSTDSLKDTKDVTSLISGGKTDMDAMKTKTVAIAQNCMSHGNPNIAANCTNINNILTTWTIPDFQFDDLSGKINEMELIEFIQISGIVNTLDTFGTTLSTALKTVANDAMITTENAGVEIKKQLADSESHLINVQEWMTKRISDIKDAKDVFDDYGQLRYGLTFLLPLLLIFITIFVILGFLTGMCCRTKNYKEKGCGNASVASDFFMINTSLIFIFTFVFAIAICGYYAFGLLGQRYICNTFDTMDNIEGLKYLDKNLNIEQYFGKGVTFEHLLTKCNENKVIYEVLLLESEIKLEEIINYLDDMGIKIALEELNTEISGQIKTLDDNYPGVNPFTAVKLLKLDDVNVPIHGDQLTTMDELVKLLNDVIAIEPNTDITANLVDYTKFTKYFTDLKTNFGKFQTLIKMGGSETFDKRCDDFIRILDECKNSITSGPVAQLGKDLTTAAIFTVEDYLNRIQDQILTTVGLCEPASVALKATLNQACGNVFNPVNAFWVANFFALIAFIPLLIIFIYLVGYFRQYVMTDDDRYRQENYYRYNPPGTRGSTIQAYDVRDHLQPTSPAPLPQASNPPRAGPPAPPPKPYTSNHQPAVPNHYYNPNSGHLSSQQPIYPSLSRGDDTLTSAAALAEKGYMKNAMGAQSRRRQDEYPYAMKGSSIATDASLNGRDDYTKF